MFSKLYIGCQSQDGDLDDFFCHENQWSRPSLLDCGRIRSGSKCDLIQCMDKLVGTKESPNASVVVLDYALCVQMLKPQFCKNSMEYTEKIFLPYIKQSIENVQKLDLVWDEYIPNNLKASTRQKRGTGVRRRVLPSMVPRNWQEFFRLDDTKKELFLFLSEQVMKMAIEGKQIIVTKGEEADTRTMVHIADAVQDGHQSVMIRSTDTDVVVLAVAAVATLEDLKELWVSYGTGKNHQILPANLFAKALGLTKSKCLPIFHALTVRHNIFLRWVWKKNSLGSLSELSTCY